MLPDGTESVVPEFSFALTALRGSKRLKRIAEFEPRLRQITVKATANNRDECWDLLTHALFSSQGARVKLVRSTHSFDVLPLDVSKLDVVRHLTNEDDESILTIGDMGRWPGNDHELLSHVHALSVDEVSPAAPASALEPTPSFFDWSAAHLVPIGRLVVRMTDGGEVTEKEIDAKAGVLNEVTFD